MFIFGCAIKEFTNASRPISIILLLISLLAWLLLSIYVYCTSAAIVEFPFDEVITITTYSINSISQSI